LYHIPGKEIHQTIPDALLRLCADLIEVVTLSAIDNKERILDDENLPLIEVDCSTDDDQVTLLNLLDHSNITRNMSLHDTRRTNFVLSELLIWTKYLQYALQRMYEVANEIDEEKEML
jgi:hypothetical protein